MFDEDYYDDNEGYPPMSRELDGGSGGGGRHSVSPPQSVIEESVIEEDEEVSMYDQGEEGRRRYAGNLSTVHEEVEGDETRRGLDQSVRSTSSSASFVSGAKAINRINQYEVERKNKHIIIQDDPRFNNTFNPKENSWEPSPNNSRVVERGDEENRSVRLDRSILPSTLDISKNNKSSSKSVKFAEKTDTRAVTPLASSSDSATLVESDVRLRPLESPIKTTRSNASNVPASFSESLVSSASSVYVSTPNDRLSKQQHTRSLRAQFSDISAIEGTENRNGRRPTLGSGFVPIAGHSRRTTNQPVARPSPSLPPPVDVDPLTHSDIINIIQGEDQQNILRALEQARKKPKVLRRPDFLSRGAASERNVPLPTGSSHSSLSSSTSLNSSSTLNRALSSTYTTSSTRQSVERSDDYGTEGRDRRETREILAKERNSSTRDEQSRNDYSAHHRLPDIKTTSMREAEGRREERGEYGRHSSGLPPRSPLRPTQRTVEEPKRRNETNTSTYSSKSMRSGQSEVQRVDSSAGSVVSNGSQKSSTGRRPTLTCGKKELDFGYVNAGETKMLVLKAINNLEYPITCNFALKSDEKGTNGGRTVFKIVDGSEVRVQPKGAIEVKVQFTPTQVGNFKNTLHLHLSGGINEKYGVSLFGLGGRAHLLVVQRPGLYPHRSGEFVLSTDSAGAITIAVENMGKRSSYVRAVVVDGEGKRVEGVSFTPSHSFVVHSSKQQPLKIDMTHARLNDSGRSSLASTNGSGYRRSSMASVNSIGSSASSGGRNAPTYTLKMYWGEETQRQRMVTYCRRAQYTAFPPMCPVDENFSLPFDGQEEKPYLDPDRNLKKFDVEHFIAAIRLITINVHITSGISVSSLDDTDEDSTLVPDDTFRGSNDTMVYMANDMTAMRIRR